MVKIFVGNLPREADEEEIKALFTEYGTVTECAIIKNFAFVHMDDRKAATKAIKNLHLHKLHGTQINVEASHGKNQGSVKLHVANVEKGCDDELRALFEEYGTVTECAVVKNFAFVHMPNYDEAMDAIKGLDNTEFQDKRIHVQISKSRPRHDERDDYPPPPPDRGGYWPPRYPGERHEPPPPSYMRGRMMPPGYPAPPLPPPPPRRAVYPDRPYEGLLSDCVAARRLLMHVTLSTSCLRLSALRSSATLTRGTESLTSMSMFLLFWDYFYTYYFFLLTVLVYICAVVFSLVDV
ncbi:RNA-binding protein 4B-like isoform X2 [Leuresthes tenuis]|uniref:RNA-binding protein 4B-like isoform X2 n=1 Tax=Leuresthes tenuis TaxID=355514 RepID=UPI003B512132